MSTVQERGALIDQLYGELEADIRDVKSGRITVDEARARLREKNRQIAEATGQSLRSRAKRLIKDQAARHAALRVSNGS